jgi:hypothetical protein
MNQPKLKPNSKQFHTELVTDNEYIIKLSASNSFKNNYMEVIAMLDPKKQYHFCRIVPGTRCDHRYSDIVTLKT